ncbi:hypothetical protein O9G_001013 [Rozella allomycis CSF55]|uniref:SH3 domain-containing protein n=1 Tax=Rozella allomycis (strain CSF55) TaxID=988480 RepID=A0A075ARI1_ROZAC|nr:hypothetical protein O9G_001013 [Rozella allomycis CSF55]|eukprot:EPZ31102.1 hypothetical protein O9G_001013 [Rozella allomycis CSF55]
MYLSNSNFNDEEHNDVLILEEILKEDMKMISKCIRQLFFQGLIGQLEDLYDIQKEDIEKNPFGVLGLSFIKAGDDLSRSNALVGNSQLEIAKNFQNFGQSLNNTFLNSIKQFIQEDLKDASELDKKFMEYNVQKQRYLKAASSIKASMDRDIIVQKEKCDQLEYSYRHLLQSTEMRYKNILEEGKIANLLQFVKCEMEYFQSCLDSLSKVHDVLDDNNKRIKMESHNNLKDGITVYALFDYYPQNLDELAFKAGDYIQITDQGWWKGRLENKMGLVPSNYISFESGTAIENFSAMENSYLSIHKGDEVFVINKDTGDESIWQGFLKDEIGFFPRRVLDIGVRIVSEIAKRSSSVKSSWRGNIDKNSLKQLVDILKNIQEQISSPVSFEFLENVVVIQEIINETEQLTKKCQEYSNENSKVDPNAIIQILEDLVLKCLAFSKSLHFVQEKVSFLNLLKKVASSLTSFIQDKSNAQNRTNFISSISNFLDLILPYTENKSNMYQDMIDLLKQTFTSYQLAVRSTNLLKPNEDDANLLIGISTLIEKTQTIHKFIILRHQELEFSENSTAILFSRYHEFITSLTSLIDLLESSIKKPLAPSVFQKASEKCITTILGVFDSSRISNDGTSLAHSSITFYTKEIKNQLEKLFKSITRSRSMSEDELVRSLHELCDIAKVDDSNSSQGGDNELMKI